MTIRFTGADSSELPHAELLDSCWHREASSDEEARLESWFDAHPDQRWFHEVLRNGLVSRDRVDVAEANVEAIVSAVLSVAESPSATNRIQLDRSNSRNGLADGLRSWSLNAIATLSLIIAIGLGAWLWQPRAEVSLRNFATQPGQRKSVSLADGSTIILGPASSVSIRSRTVHLTGEAHFTVSPISSNPFTVITNNAQIQVLGTAFTVRQYSNETQSRVVVETGRVALYSVRKISSNTEPTSKELSSRTILGENTLAVVTDSGIIVSPSIQSKSYTSWTNGVLTFREAYLRDVVTELSRAYGAGIQITDTTLAQRVVQLEVSTTDDPLDLVLGTLCKVTGAHYTSRATPDGRLYILSPGRAAHQPAKTALPRNEIPQLELYRGK